MANLGSLTATLGVDTSGLMKAERTFKSVLGRMKSQVFSLKGALIALGGAFAIRELKRGIVDVTHMAGRYEELGIAMKVAGQNAGYSADEVAAFQKAVEKSGIAAIEAREVLTRMSVAQIDLAHSQKLARAAQDLAVVGAINSSEAFERLIYGLQTAQVRVLRTIGLNVTFEEGYKKLAKSIGKTTEELTEQEKTQSRVNTVLEASARYQGLYEQAMTSAEKQFRSLKRYVDNFKVALGQAFQPAYLALVLKFTELFKKARDAVGDITFSKNLELIATKVVDSFSFMINMMIGGISKLKKEGKLEEYFTGLSKTVVSVMKRIAYIGAVASDALRGVVLAFKGVQAFFLWYQTLELRGHIKSLQKAEGGYKANKQAIDSLADSLLKAEKKLEQMNKTFEEAAMQPLAVTQVQQGFKQLEEIWKNQEEVTRSEINVIKELEEVSKSAIAGIEDATARVAIESVTEKQIESIKKTMSAANDAIKQAAAVSETEGTKTASIWKSVIEKSVESSRQAILDAARAQSEAADSAKKQADEQNKMDNTMSYIVEGQQQFLDLSNETKTTFSLIKTEVDKGALSVDDLKGKVDELNRKLEIAERRSANISAAFSAAATAGVTSHTGGTTLEYTTSEERGGFLPKAARVQHFQDSGIMSGFSSKDKYLGAFRAGEAFLSPETVGHYGKDFVKGLIDRSIPKSVSERVVLDLRVGEGSYPIVVEKSPTYASLLKELKRQQLVSGG